MSTVGLVAATFAPMRPDGDLDLDRIPVLVEHLVGEGVDGLFCNGSTGEGESLTPDERRQVATAFVNAAAGRVRVFVQVGANSVRVARELAAHAAEAGADAIAAIPPAYFKPATVEDAVACLREVASAAPETPCFYYHIPSLTGVRLDVPELQRQAGDTIPSFAGVKFSEVNPPVFEACVRFGEHRHEVYWGSDETLLTGLSAGARAAIGSTYCFASKVYRKVIEAHREGDFETAQSWQAQAARMVEIQARHGGLAGLKATMRLIGVDCGPVRLPLRAPSAGTLETLRSELEEIGFFDWGRS